MKNFYIQILGCQQNAHDAAKLAHLLANCGLKESTENAADVVIVTACAVRQTGVDRIHGKLRRWKNKKVLLTGCMLESDKRKFLEAGALFFDIEKPSSLVEILNIKSKRDVERVFEEGKKFSSSVPIMFGCNNFCSYCATPYTRGRERSRDFNDIINEVKALVEDGKTEILLLGQNVNSYNDLKAGKTFEDLLRKLNDLDGDFIIAFTSNHPKDMTDGIIDAVATLPKISKKIHLPLQSGSDKILKAMNRPYTVQQYLALIENCKLKIKNLSITTDVIVGFPSETENDFQKTVNVFEKVKYEMAYINKYSPRVGTAAYKLGDPISWQEKKRRWQVLDKILRKHSKKFA